MPIRLTRKQFLALGPALALAGCGAPASGPEAASSLGTPEPLTLDYAQQFTAARYADGCTLITLPADDARFLVVPEGVPAPDPVPEGATLLQQPIRNIYLVATSAMDLFLALEGLDSIALSGTRSSGWYLPQAAQAMEEGRIAYAGKYSAPDYERILNTGCGLALESTMIWHTPEVKEQLERFGIPVLVERSSYESSPLGRMEWIKLYGILLGKEELAQQVFQAQVEQIAPLLDLPASGKRCAFFSLTASGLATVRKGGDYIAQMIEMAGGSYVFAHLTDGGSSLSTINLPLEDFYAGARDADVLIYNSTIEGTVASTQELVAKCPMLADFRAVQQGQVWCTSPGLFQQSMELAQFITQLHQVFTQPHPAGLQMLTPVP